ncbi:MAG: 30S ribosomal protein S4 [Patescibacteria group bacterium]|jgi:small subunit ribosomal protein S4
MKNIDPKCKQCRRLGEKLMFKGERCRSAKCALSRRNYIPGFHGPKQRPNAKKSDYSRQLAEKQKARKQYLLSERQFRNIFDAAAKKIGNTEELLLKLLETRLDNIVYRLGFALSRSEARQLVNHGHFTVNSHGVNIPSYRVRAGMVIKIREASKRKKKFVGVEARIKNAEIPCWLHMNMEDLSGKVLHDPAVKDIRSNIDTHVIVEFYSR